MLFALQAMEEILEINLSMVVERETLLSTVRPCNIIMAAISDLVCR